MGREKLINLPLLFSLYLINFVYGFLRFIYSVFGILPFLISVVNLESPANSDCT